MGASGDSGLLWVVVFSRVDAVPRYPSPLYEALLEGFVLFALVWEPFWFIVEIFREPDDFLGLLSLGMSMGQWLCVPMIVGGAALWFWARLRAAAGPVWAVADA